MPPKRGFTWPAPSALSALPRDDGENGKSTQRIPGPRGKRRSVFSSKKPRPEWLSSSFRKLPPKRRLSWPSLSSLSAIPIPQDGSENGKSTERIPGPRRERRSVFSLPEPPTNFFGRNVIIEDLLGFVERSESIILVGAAGIGKTFIALALLHHARISAKFGHRHIRESFDHFQSAESADKRRKCPRSALS